MDRATNFSEDWIILHLTMSHRWFSVFHPPGYSGTRHAFGTRTSKEHCSTHRGAIRLETSGTDCLAYRPRKTSTRGYLDGHIATVFLRRLSSGPKDVGKKKKRGVARPTEAQKVEETGRKRSAETAIYGTPKISRKYSFGVHRTAAVVCLSRCRTSLCSPIVIRPPGAMSSARDSCGALRKIVSAREWVSYAQGRT
jgi:hypothetical protein